LDCRRRGYRAVAVERIATERAGVGKNYRPPAQPYRRRARAWEAVNGRAAQAIPALLRCVCAATYRDRARSRRHTVIAARVEVGNFVYTLIERILCGSDFTRLPSGPNGRRCFHHAVTSCGDGDHTRDGGLPH
jgi:hypothetical protein